MNVILLLNPNDIILIIFITLILVLMPRMPHEHNYNVIFSIQFKDEDPYSTDSDGEDPVSDDSIEGTGVAPTSKNL